MGGTVRWLGVLVVMALCRSAGATVIEGFEQPTELQLGGMQVQPASRLQLSERDPFEGKRCAELHYRFEKVSGLQYLEVIAPHRLTEKPRRFSVAVRGDGSGNIVRARFVDAGGEWHQYDLGVLHFRGWRVLWTHLDTPHGHWGGDGNGRLDFPVTFFSLVLDSLVRPSEGVVAFDAVSAHYGEEVQPPVNAQFVPARRWGYFWGATDPPTGKLVLTNTTNAPVTVAVSVQLLNHREEPVRSLWRSEVTVTPGKPVERTIALHPIRFGVHFVAIQLTALTPERPSATRLVSVCWLPEPAPIGEDSPFGVCTHFGQFKHKVPDTLDLMRRMGAAWLRDELYWSEVEREQGKFIFPTYYDAYMRAAGESGIRPLIIFNYANRHYDNGVAPHTDAGREAFARYCRALIERYGRICRHWEVWNEPNIGFWQPKPNPADYTALLKTVYTTVKSVDPQATVVGVCTAGTDLGFIEAVLQRDGGKFMDALSVHPYRYPRSPEASDFVGEMQRLKALLDKYGAGHLKVWLTEFGYPTHITGGTPQWLSAAYIVRTFLWALTLPFIERVFVYDFQDDGDDPTYNEFNFGLIRFDHSPKVGYAAFNTMVRMLARKRFLRQAAVGDGAVCLVFGDATGEVWTLWATQGERRVTVPVTASVVTVTDLMGNSQPMRPVRGQLTLTLTEEPLFVTIAAQRRRATR
ncbi:Beta-xylosidase [bacterium HR17]|uniref:Beta-xylosidase n=1 Tax=Candidatus Fervidibacter japonicus TaxID=2035412 RepID=A0A2H5XDX0_9BACT|nr:Beta-xylosidase [bacterium HR17]